MHLQNSTDICWPSNCCPGQRKSQSWSEETHVLETGCASLWSLARMPQIRRLDLIRCDRDDMTCHGLHASHSSHRSHSVHNNPICYIIARICPCETSASRPRCCADSRVGVHQQIPARLANACLGALTPPRFGLCLRHSTCNAASHVQVVWHAHMRSHSPFEGHDDHRRHRRRRWWWWVRHHGHRRAEEPHQQSGQKSHTNGQRTNSRSKTTDFET